MTTLRALVLDVAPASLPHLGAVARGLLRFDWLDQKSGQRDLSAWVHVERGALVKAPARSRARSQVVKPAALRPAWRQALGADAAVVKVHAVGAAGLVEIRPAGGEERRLVWCVGKRATDAPGAVPRHARVALLSQEVAAVWNPDARSLRLLRRDHPAETTHIALPARFGATTADTHHAPFLVVPGEGCLLVRGMSSMLVIRVDELASACGVDEVAWGVETLRPRGADPPRPKETPVRAATRPAPAPEPDGEDEDEEPFEQGELLWLRDARGPSLDAAVAAVRAAGLLSSFARHGAVGATLADVLRHHYETHPEQGPGDRFFRCETPFLDATDDLIADLGELVPGRPVWRQVSVDHESVIVVGRDGQRKRLRYDMTSEVVEAYNGALAQAGSTWRVLGVRLDRGLDGFFALDRPMVSRLAEAGLLTG